MTGPAKKKTAKKKTAKKKTAKKKTAKKKTAKKKTAKKKTAKKKTAAKKTAKKKTAKKKTAKKKKTTKTAVTASATEVPLAHARRHWYAQSGLGGAFAGTKVTQAARCWVRTLGGVDAYLALRARRPETTRAEVDAAVADGSLAVTPAVRGCMYLLPRERVAPAMKLAATLTRPRTSRDLDKVGSSWREVTKLAREVHALLGVGALTTAAIRKALPDASVRSLGERGKKVGLSSLLPIALRELEFDGRVRRMPVGRCLDTERYEWAHASDAVDLPDDIPGLLAEVLKNVLPHAGPVPVKTLAAWMGVPQRDLKSGLERIDAVECVVETMGVCVVGREQLDGLLGAAASNDRPSFLPFDDTSIAVRGGPGPLTDAEHHGIKVERWGAAKPTTLGDAKHLGWRSISLDGRIVGFWEWDPGTERVAWRTFARIGAKDRRAIASRAQQLGTFIRDDLGHGRSFSLDSDESLAKRVVAITK